MEKEKNKNNTIEEFILSFPKKYYPFVAAVITAVSLYMGFSLAGMLSGGIYAFDRGDLLESHVPYILDMCRSISNGESIWYSSSISMGMNNSLVLAYYTLSPFNILFLIFPNADPNVISTIVIILKLSLSAAFFQIFSKYVLKRENLWSIIISACYALCGFSVTYGTYHIMWLDGFMALPLLCFLICRSFEKNKYVAVSLCYAYIFSSQFYIGFMVGIFSFIFVLSYLVYKYNKNFKEISFKFLKWILSVFLGVLLSSVVWLPALMFLLYNNPPDATQFRELEASLLEILNSMFWGQYIDNVGRKSFSYSGIVVLLFLPFYFFNKKINVKERVISSFVLSFVLLWYVVPPLYAFMHANDAPDFFWYRFSFIFSFVVCSIALRQSDYSNIIPPKKYFIVLGGLIFFYIIEQRISLLENENYVSNNIYNLLINISFILLWLLIIYGLNKASHNKAAVYLASLLLVCTETSTNLMTTLDNKTLENTYENFEYIDKTAVNYINSIDKDFFRILICKDIIHNSDSQFGYYGLVDFGSGENFRLRKTLSNIGFGTTPRMTMVTGYNPVNEMLMGVRYNVYGAYYHDFQYRNYDVNDVVGYIKNDTALNIGYMVRDDILNYSFPSRNVFININSLLSVFSGIDEECFVKIPKENIHYSYDNAVVYFNEDTGKYYYEREGDNASVTVNIDAVDNCNPYVQFEIAEANVRQNSPAILEGVKNIVNSWDSPIMSSASFEIMPSDDGYRYSFGTNENSNTVYEFDNINYYYYILGSEKKHYEELSKEQFCVTEYSNGHIKGKVNSKETGKVLFMTIPYDSGWTAKANGNMINILPVLNDSFMAIELPSVGEFEIELNYETPGLKKGVILSAIGLVLCILLIIKEKEYLYLLKIFSRKNSEKNNTENINNDLLNNKSEESDSNNVNETNNK